MKKLLAINRWNIHKRLMFFFLLVSIVPLIVVGMIFYYISYTDNQQKNDEYLENNINLISSNITNYINQYNQEIMEIAFSTELQEIYPEIINLNENNYDDFLLLADYRNTIERYFANNFSADENILSIGFYPSATDKPFSSGIELPINDYKQNSAYIKMINIPKGIVWTGATGLCKRTMSNEVVTVMTTVINRFYSRNEGVLAINLYEKELEDKYRNSISEGGFIYIIDEQGEIVSAVEKSIIGHKIENNLLECLDEMMSTNAYNFNKIKVNNNYMDIAITKIEKSDWFVIQGVSYFYLMRSVRKIFYMVLATVVCCIIVAVVISEVFSQSISCRIKVLQKKMKEVEYGDLNTSIDIVYYDEFGDLVRGFNNMVRQIKESVKREKKANIDKANAEFLALQAQINPHFIYNTLDSINWMANMAHMDDIAQMLTSLANILRFSLDKGPSITQVRNEIENLNNYIRIQQNRYHHILNIKLDIDEEIMDFKIIKFLLQPIVENTIYHAFEKIDEGCCILITGIKQEDFIVFKIIDNGIGMDQKTIEKCRVKSNNNKEAGYALYNIIQRLNIFYSENGKLNIDSELEVGTTVTITIPCIKEEDSDGKNKSSINR